MAVAYSLAFWGGPRDGEGPVTVTSDVLPIRAEGGEYRSGMVTVRESHGIYHSRIMLCWHQAPRDRGEGAE